MGCVGSKRASVPSEIRGVEPAVAEPPPRAKIVLLGDSGVGKSCLVLRYVRGAFDPSSKVTVGAAFTSHSIGLPNGKFLKFEIWDTAGQERYASLAPLYYRGASAAVVVYDITNKETFAKAKHWISELHRNAGASIVIVLVGNKTDLVEEREVSEEEGKELAERNGMLFLESSAKTAANCVLIFESIAKKLSGYIGSDLQPSGADVQPQAPSQQAEREQPSKAPENANDETEE